MRTVSFSNRQVQDLLNNQFVCTSTSTEGDPTAGQSIWHRPNDPPGGCIRGNGKQNVQTIFMTPAGEIFHVATGFLPPEAMVEEIQFASALFREMQASDEPEAIVVRDAHAARLQQLGFSDQQINGTGNPMEMILSGMQGMPSTMQMQSTGGQSFGGFDMNRPFEGFIRQQLLDDNKFSMKYPMMTRVALEQNPAALVGDGKTFFASSSSGGSR